MRPYGDLQSNAGGLIGYTSRSSTPGNHGGGYGITRTSSLEYIVGEAGVALESLGRESMSALVQTSFEDSSAREAFSLSWG